MKESLATKHEYYVEYNAYLSYLFKLEENKGLTEKQLNIKYNLINNTYHLDKYSLNKCRRCKIPSNSYRVRPFLVNYTNFTSLSDVAYISLLAVKLTKDRLDEIKVPYDCIYDLIYNKQAHVYLREVSDLFILKNLAEKLADLKTQEEILDYQRCSQGPIYAKEENQDGTINLTQVHGQLPNNATYFLVDEEYPPSLRDFVEYLKVYSPDSFVLADLPESLAKKKLRKRA